VTPQRRMREHPDDRYRSGRFVAEALRGCAQASIQKKRRLFALATVVSWVGQGAKHVSRGRLASGRRGARAALLAACLEACAANNSPLASASPLERQFAAAVTTWDLSHDGDVTCEEWRQYASALFREADVDHDGMLTPEEFAAMARKDRLFELAGFAYFDADVRRPHNARRTRRQTQPRLHAPRHQPRLRDHT